MARWSSSERQRASSRPVPGSRRRPSLVPRSGLLDHRSRPWPAGRAASASERRRDRFRGLDDARRSFLAPGCSTTGAGRDLVPRSRGYSTGNSPFRLQLPNGTSPHDSSRSTPTKQIPWIVCGGTTGQTPGGYWIVQVIGGTLPFMRAIRRFTVRPVLPDALAALGELAGNLRWSWHPPAQDVFAEVDPELWETTGRDPVRLLGAVGNARLEELAADEGFLERLAVASADLERYLTEDRWYQRRGGNGPASIAYFSPEFGITAVLPQYSGGLGILAGDHLKAASDLGVPIVGVGLLYRHGYFKQSLSREGWQQETYPVLDPDGLPISLLREADGKRATIIHRAARRPGPGGPDLGGQGRPGADADARHRRRGQPRPLRRDHRPAVRRQQRAPAAAGDAARRRRGAGAAGRGRRITGAPEPEVFHTNEGHAGFLGIERIRELTVDEAGPQLDLETAIEIGRASTVFTTHTPVPAGIDRFPRTLVEQYFSDAGATPGRAGRADPGARHRGLRGRRPVGLQHGGDGLPAGAARQRRLAAARRGQPRDVQRAVAGVRRGGGADRVDHQRRARAHVGRPRGVRAGRGPRRRRRLRRRRGVLGRGRQDPGRRDVGGQAALRERLVAGRPRAGSAGPGASAAPPRPSSAGSTPRSTPTC